MKKIILILLLSGTTSFSKEKTEVQLINELNTYIQECSEVLKTNDLKKQFKLLVPPFLKEKFKGKDNFVNDKMKKNILASLDQIKEQKPTISSETVNIMGKTYDLKVASYKLKNSKFSQQFFYIQSHWYIK